MIFHLFFRYPPQYSEIMSDYERTTTTSAGNTKTVPRSELSAKSNRSTSSGRGSVEEDEDADVEIRMINEGNWNMQTSVQSTTGKNILTIFDELGYIWWFFAHLGYFFLLFWAIFGQC